MLVEVTILESTNNSHEDVYLHVACSEPDFESKPVWLTRSEFFSVPQRYLGLSPKTAVERVSFAVGCPWCYLLPLGCGGGSWHRARVFTGNQNIMNRSAQGYKSASNTPWLHNQAIVNGITIHYVQAGRREAPILLCLHGFAEFWYVFKPFLVDLSRHYRVVAPDLRGFNLSDKNVPSSPVWDVLVEDCVGLVELLRHSTSASTSNNQHRVFLLGRGWGGEVAARTVAQYPEIFERLVLVQPNQLWRPSPWLQFPCLPECLLGWQQSFLLTRWFASSEVEDVNAHRDALNQPGVLHAILAYHRHGFHCWCGQAVMDPFVTNDVSRGESSTITIPTLVLSDNHSKPLPLWIQQVVRGPLQHWSLGRDESMAEQVRRFCQESLALWDAEPT